MSASRTCEQCGSKLPEAAFEGLCPRCLADWALNPDADFGEPPASTPEPDGENEPLGTRRFGDYELLEEIARGGMGVVYKARQRSLNRIVALKMILAGQLASKEQVERFRAEAQAAAHLQHPNIVAIHEVGEADGQHYFSMDYVEGRNLADLLREGPMVARQAAIYLRTIAEAVHCAHQHGIIHRDLKPSNVLIDGNDQPRITDFGLAKRLAVPPSGGVGTGRPAEAGTTYDLTLSGQVLGSPNYLPPEQAGGKRAEVGPPSDVYALGAILYHLLTGRPPFQAESLTTLIRQVLETEPVAPRLLNPSIPCDLETICLKCLEKEIPRRYPSAVDLAEELGRFLEDKPIRARPVRAPEKVWRWCRRKPMVASLGAISVLLLLAVAIGSPIAAYRINRERQRVEAEKLANQRMAYNSDMSLAFRALADRTRGRARELMERHRPRTKSEADLRGWEWRYLWQQSAGQSAVTLCARRKSIERLAFTPDSRRLWVGELLGGISLWDLTRKEPVLEYPELTYRGGSAFDPPRNRVAQCFSRNGRDFILWVRDAGKADPVFTFETNTFVTAPAFSADGRRLAARVGSDTVWVWNLETRQPVTSVPTRTFYGNTDVRAIALSPRGNLLAVPEATREVHLWELSSGRLTALPQRTPALTWVGFSPDGKYLACTGGPYHGFHVWDVATLARRDLQGLARAYTEVAFDGTRPLLAVGAGEEHVIEFWDLETGQYMIPFKGPPEMLVCLALSPDGALLATGGWGSGMDKAHVRLWNRRGVQPQPTEGYRTLPNLYSAPAFAADSRTFLAALGSVIRFDTATLQTNEVLTAYGTNNSSVALSPDGALLVTGDWGGRIHVWETRSQRLLTHLRAGRYPVRRLRFLARGHLLVAHSGTEFGGMWETASWQEKKLQNTGDAVSVAVSTADASSDGRWLATGHCDGRIRLWDLATGERVEELVQHTDWVMYLAFSPDGRWLGSVGRDDLVLLRDLRGGLETTALRGQNCPTYDLVFSPDSRRIVVSLGNPDQAVGMWDVATSRLVAILPGEGLVHREPTLSPDGNTLVVINRNNLGLFWRAPSFAEIEAAEKERASLQGSSGPPEAMKR